ncbi:MAG: radical SAM protein [Euryarchaeota archaeon]|nr:radical SAM protein [Euryarchaeota archaeon]
MMVVRAHLPKYHAILEENGTAQYLDCKHIPVSFETSQPTDELRELHDETLRSFHVQNMIQSPSLLDLKIELADRLFQACCFCECKCKIDRRKTPGVCGVQEARIATEFLHFGEETALVPSHTIFFSGCTFQCVFCQNWDISQLSCGMSIAPEQLGNVIEQRKKQGAYNVNWVGGDPTSNLLYILQVLQNIDTNIAQVWNSNMYCSEETMKLLHGVIDIYLTDFKYGNDTCAKRLSKVDGYTAVVRRNHLLASEHGEMLIRHLVLPNHIDCCSKPVITFIAKHLSNSLVNIMAQYKPEYRAYEQKDIARSISPEEVLQVKEYAEKLGIHQI